MSKIPKKFYLTEDQMPTAWYNLRSDMPEKPDPMRKADGTPVTQAELASVFTEDAIALEFDTETRYVDIPGEVLDYYKSFRPSPLIRAYALEKALDTPAKIYYKFEGSNTSGSHKLNSASAQAYYAKKMGLKGVTTETGAGQWGTALAMSCAYFHLDCKVFMVKVSAEQKPYRRAVIETYGADLTPSPSLTTSIGQKLLREHPDTGGSLGCAISEAVELAAASRGYRYVLGSVMDHVLVHQSVIGQESKLAMEMLGEYPDIVIGCAGGGSNLGGLMAAFMQDKLTGKRSPRFIAVEPLSCPSLTRGHYAYDYGDAGHITPLTRMYTLGCEFIPSANHAGGLRYHGMSPIISKLYHDGFLDEARAADQRSVFEAAVLFAKTETILPAPESSHAIRAAIDEAVVCRESGEGKTILFGLSGTGYFDMTAYANYLSGAMSDEAPTDAYLQTGLDKLPKLS